MGRSKFPGKPSKHVNRKRINVLPPISEGIIECSGPMTVETVAENKQVENNVEEKSECVNLNSTINAKVSLRRRLNNRKMQSSKALISNNSSKRGIMSKLCNKNSVKLSVKNKLNCKGSKKKSTITRKSVHSYSPMKNFKQCRSGKTKESNNLVGKFVLPTRSVHSSRVIKPNKRFINVDLSETLTLKKRVINKRHCIKQSESSSKNNLSKNASATESSTKPFSNGGVVLRQARLKLHNQTPKGSEGPFSSTSTNGSPPGTVTCGVCGAVRFYRFVKQARKFNIYSCESCRKFISKMIKRQSCGKNANSSTLVCHKGQGMCHVPPIVRSQQMKLIRCAYRSRCPACWLKMCLRSFQMPLSLKNSLIQLLPKNMQGSDVMFNNSLPLLWQVSVQNIDNQISKQTRSEQSETVHQRPVRFKSAKPVTQNLMAPSSDIKRQKIDLKGPRVKHVCRSASIVLGQPLATFPLEAEKKKEFQEQISIKKIQSNKSMCNIILENSDAAQLTKSSKDECSENESSDNDKVLKVPLPLSESIISHIKRDRSQRVPLSFSSMLSASYENKCDFEKKPILQETQNLISIDYWEKYDLEDINQNGFSLISSQQFSMPAICFLCGSAGRETLLHCSLCCEPYHPYCLERSPPIVNSNNNKQYKWLCPRCATCNACHQVERQKFNCQKCSKAYHPECFKTDWTGKSRPTICSKCQSCKDCGEMKTANFFRNLSLCDKCFTIRKKGNSCAVCLISFKDVELNEKMMECTKCKKWVHASCENLSEEYYHIFSYLPESVKYVCSVCCKQSPSYWYKALESELKISFNQVLWLLSKNKKAKNMLKLSLLNNYIGIDKKVQMNCENSDDNHYDNLSHFKIDNSERILNDNPASCKTSSEFKMNQTKSVTILDIKRKCNSHEYSSVRDFNKEMEEALGHGHLEELLNIYQSIFKSVFPWFNSANAADEIISKIDAKRRISTNTNGDEEIDQIECVSMDSRYCSLCKSIGDGLSHLESRLLYCGQNEWVHVNCALWSSEVYEEIDGSLQNVHEALTRGLLMRCSCCKQKGATVGCCFKSCSEVYHFLCARTAKCHFLYDKTVYCCSHELPKNSSVIVALTDFDIRRSVFVELSDYKKGQFSHSEKVNVMVGSLCVTNLGKINPTISDTREAIIPTGYSCSRLFWSTVEPWRLVWYKISTSTLNAHVNNLYIDKSFTVDHSLPKSVVERKLKEILLWHKDIDKKKIDVIEFDDEEEPQNGADLLSPEITDAIFEELPHELLDGISVQDIFPKLMSYEDFISMDSKPETNNSDTNNTSDIKKSEQDIENIEEFDGKDFKSKFDSPDIKNKNQQRSCNLTVSCKLDNSFSPVIKKRKIAPRENNLFFHLLQVDGNFDDSSSDCGSPIGVVPNMNVWNSDLSEEPVTCERCQCTYRTQASYKRHLDACELICTSESDSELNQDQDSNINVNLETNPQIHIPDGVTHDLSQPLLITSYESYQNEIHTSVLNTQTFVASKSTAEVISIPRNSEIMMPQISQKPSISEISCATEQATLTEPVVGSEVFTVPEPTSQTAQFCLNPVSLCVNPSLTLQPTINQTIAINQVTQPTTVQPQLEFQPSPVTIQSLPYSTNVTPIINPITLNNPNIINSVINVPGNRWVKSVDQTMFPPKSPTKVFKGRGRSIAIKRNHAEDETVVIPPTNSTPSVIVQHLPSTNFMPTFVDTFQQQSGQNLQYVTTITPQTIPPQPLVQFQADNNLISLLPGIQPTMIIQQPRVLENQLIVDGNGSLSWTPAPQQVQPVYYGFETIVQNTVMQSQQFLPSTVPGVLTANSSYSTTTQVFQTSKLEPVLDVATNSFVLVNTGQLVNSQSLEVPQNTLTNVLQTEINSCKHSTSSLSKQNNQTVAVNSNSITLPVAPFVPEQGIPTNIVTPTPKTITTQSRPMSRVLPMQTLKETKETKTKLGSENIEVIRKEIKTCNKIIKPLPEFEKKTPSVTCEKKPIHIQIETDSNKKDLTFKQTQDVYKVGNDVEESVLQQPNQNFTTNNFSCCKPTETAYKLNNNFNSRNSPVQIAPLKPIKSNFNPPKSLHILSLSDKQNRQQEKFEKKIVLESPKQFPAQEKKENENVPSILYTIETQDGFKYSSTSISDLWTKVFEAVQSARAAHNMPLLPSHSTNIVSSLQILGLKTSGLKYLIEQLPGAAKCTKYRPSFNFPSKYVEIEDDLVGHSSGCARCAPNVKRNEPYDMFGWLASKHRKPEHSLFCSDLVPRRGSVNNLPMAMRFRQLKLASKYSVGVYRSKIHRRGLFCLRDFEAGEMVIEYSGEVIRSVLTDKREKFYNSKGIGCYMFRIDDNLVVDATMTGNAARFINHSCDPNCYSKVVEILGHKHIIIFALRRIICGEELTYDYKFPIEEDKIPCTCGTRRCRKFLN